MTILKGKNARGTRFPNSDPMTDQQLGQWSQKLCLLTWNWCSLFPRDFCLSQLWSVAALAGAAGREPLPSAGWALCSPAWIKKQLLPPGTKTSERSFALNERKEIKTLKATAANFISVRNKWSRNLFGLAWQRSCRGFHCLHPAVPVVALCLFQRRVVRLLCPSWVCVCGSCRKSCLADAHRIGMDCSASSL